MRSRIFRFIAYVVGRHPWKVVIAAVVLAVASGICAATMIRLNANLDELVSERLDYHRRYIEFLKEFGDEEYLYIVVDAEKDLPRAKRFLDVLGSRLKGRPGLKQVIWKIENPQLERNFLLYLSTEQLGTLKTMLTQGPFSVGKIASWSGFAPMFGALADRIGGPISPSDEKELATGFTFIDGLLGDMSSALEEGTVYRSRIQELFFGGGETFDPDGFLKNGSLLFMLIMPSKDYATASVIERPLKEVRTALAETKRRFPDIDAGLTGRPVLNADEMETSNRDMTIATILALCLVALAFIFFFRGVARPLCAVAALVVGISWTFGFVALAIGTLNILSSVFALLLIGASVEYSIYIVARYEEELSASSDPAAAITRALGTTGMAQVTSAFTTAAAFLTLLWTDFTALAQLGIISAIGIIFCLTSMLVVLPALLLLRDRHRSPVGLKKVSSFGLPQLVKLYTRPALVFTVAVLVIAAASPFVKRIGFDNNLLNLQARGLESVKYEHLIIDKSGETTWFARDVADSVGESHALAEKFKKLPSVRGVDDVERIVPTGQDEKIAIVGEIGPSFEGITFSQVSDSFDARLLMYELGRLASSLVRLEEEAFQAGRADAVEELEKFSEKIQGLVSLIAVAGDSKLKNLGRLQREFFSDLQRHLSILSTGMHPGRITLADLPQDMAGRFVSPGGRYALFVYPKENIWDPSALERFVSDIRGVDPKVIGTPIEVHESGILMRKTFARSAALAFVLICILVWLDFRTFRAALIAIIPLASGMILLFELMGVFKIQFNMANFFAIPILIGTGVDFGVQVAHRLRQEGSFAALGTSTGRSLVMTAVANGIGFGTMMIAHHRGIASLGQILALGCACCLVGAVVVAPPVAKWLSWGRKAVTRNT